MKLGNEPSARPSCLVYTLERQGGGWIITDIDLEDEQSLPGEISRFTAD